MSSSPDEDPRPETTPQALTERLSDTFGEGADPRVDLRPDEDEGGLAGEVVRRLSGREGSFSRYDLKGEIARGGQGAVLKVWDSDLRRELAMKVIAAGDETQPASETDSKTLGRFLEEAQVTGQLDHPGIVPIHELGLDDEGRVYFTMKLVRGRELAQIFDFVREGKEGWTVTRALGLMLKVCEAMAYAHYKGVIHRDLKPANVMIGRFGAVYVMDWGIARVLDREDGRDIRIQPLATTQAVRSNRKESGAKSPDSPLLTMDGDVMGTPAYMSPEQAKGQLDKVGPQTDVYALGAMLYHLLTGQMPYVPADGVMNAYAVWSRVQEGPPRPLHELASDVPAELAAICGRAMARELSDRYASMDELAADLQAYVEGRVVRAYETGTWAETKKWVRRNKPLAASVAAAVVLLAGGLAGTLVLKRQADEQRSLAQTNEQRAVASEAEAKEQARIAAANEALAVQRADHVLRLSALQELDDLIAEADGLWPALPERTGAYESWLERARALVADLPEHRAKREELRSLAVPRSSTDRARDRREHPRAPELEAAREELTASLASFDAALASGDDSVLEELEAQIVGGEERIASLEEEIDRPWRWSFERAEDRWWHAQVSKLIEGIDALADEETGLILGISAVHGWGIERRLEFARTVEERTVTGDEARQRWEEAQASIRDVGECPQYGGLVLEPQLGLLPIGRDPDSGLWEFWHVMSGEEPLRDDSGKLVLEEEMGVVLVLLPGGEFWMGAQSSDTDGQNYDPQAASDEGPVHEVELSPFFLSKYELTQGQWKRFKGTNPSYSGPDGRWSGNWSRWKPRTSFLHPVEQVSWYEAKEVLARLGLVLPSEAQWEYGCRGGTSSPWWSGEDQEGLEGVANLSDQYGKENGNESFSTWDAWLDDGSTTHAEVGTYGANPFGLHDVHGNVWEWCLDGYDSGYTHATALDPVSSPDASVLVVFRGGGFNSTARYARSANRLNSPSLADDFLGVRPARVITE